MAAMLPRQSGMSRRVDIPNRREFCKRFGSAADDYLTQETVTMTRPAITAIAMLFAAFAVTGSARAQNVIEINEPLVAASSTPIADAVAFEGATLAAAPQEARPVAIEFSDAHETRAKIHKYA